MLANEPASDKTLREPVKLDNDSTMDLDRVTQFLADGAMPLIRTDFSSDDAWQHVVEEVSKESDIVGDGDGYTPNVEPISDTGFASVTPEALVGAWPRAHHGHVILADERSMREARSDGDLTVLFIDLSANDEDEAEFGWVFGRSFRCVAPEVAGIEANLSIANMDFTDFADSADDDGVFRGF
ncbi:MAG: DUF6924 domain-containing protein [Marmoricola sp.]